MFNEYEVFQMMKFRQEETECKAKVVWKHYVQSTEVNASIEKTLLSTTSTGKCCPCPCD